MNKLYALIIVVMLSTIAFATNPNISSIDYNNLYAGRTAQINLSVNPDTTNGLIEFYEGTTLISQTQYNSSTSTLQFTRNWSNYGDKNIIFRMVDINGEDTNILDNTFAKTINVKKGIDLEITTLTTSPTKIAPQNTVQILVKMINSGDENTFFLPVLMLYYNSELITTQTLTSFDVNAEKSITVDWTPPADFNGGFLKAYLNNNNLFSEFSLLNNEKTIALIGTSLADLIAKDLSTKTDFRKDFLETITILIDNNGERAVEDATVEIYLDSVQDNKRIFSNLITIGANSKKSIDFVYSFAEVKEYKLILVVNRSNAILESSYSNNRFEKRISVFDFNSQAIIVENERLKKELIVAEGKYQASDIEKSTCLSSLATLRSTNESCASNLEICNSNNNTKISNYMVSMDANRNAEKTIYLGEIARMSKENASLQSSFDARVIQIENEKNEWILLCVAIFIAILGYVVWDEYLSKGNRSSMNSSGGRQL